MYKNLEDKVESHYKSAGESIIGETLEKYGIQFDYEKQILVEDQRPGDTEKERIWYPDFYLEDKGIVIEYLGRPNDRNYMEGAERRKETYEKMGLKVIQVTPYNVFYKSGDKYKRRPDFEDALLEAITYVENKGQSTRLKKGNLETNIVDNYNYKSGRFAA